MTLLTVGCLAAPAARADDDNGIAELLAIQQAFIDRDYEKVFRIVLPSVTHGPPEYRAAEAEFAVGFYLLGGLEMLQADDQSGILWLRPDLSEKLPVDERISAGMIWIRRAAYHGSLMSAFKGEGVFIRPHVAARGTCDAQGRRRGRRTTVDPSLMRGLVTA